MDLLSLRRIDVFDSTPFQYNGRAALPPLNSAKAINRLNAQQTIEYCRGYGCRPIPQRLEARKEKIAQAIGCPVIIIDVYEDDTEDE